MSETFKESVRRMALDGSDAKAIAIALLSDVPTVQGLIWRMRQRYELPAVRINGNGVPGQMLELLAHYAPQPVSRQAITRSLGCGTAGFRKALARLVDIGAVLIDSDGLVHLRNAEAGASLTTDDRPERLPDVNPELRARLLHNAVIRRAWALVKTGDRDAATSLLNRAAERSPTPIAINFLVLGDLIGAGHSRYPEISDEDAERLRVDAGFMAGAEVRAALASEASA